MSEIIKLNVADYNKIRGVETLHPLVSVIELSRAEPMPPHSFQFGFYAVYLKELECGELRYGRNTYDYQEGTLVFIGPGQIIGKNPNPAAAGKRSGWVLLFDPELIKGTPLGKHIHEYSFWSYEVNEALHLAEKEREMVLDAFRKILYEIERPVDQHSKMLIASNIELFLNYCIRFYDRQFITRDHANKGVQEKFEGLLHDYFLSDKPQSIGLPSVGWCAEALHLSPKYFGDLIKKETGTSAQEYIQSKVIDVAKERIFDIDKSISELAYELGFKYPQHFTRLFKQKVGMAPHEYRVMN